MNSFVLSCFVRRARQRSSVDRAAITEAEVAIKNDRKQAPEEPNVYSYGD
jgi:hypothetical protein